MKDEFVILDGADVPEVDDIAVDEGFDIDDAFDVDELSMVDEEDAERPPLVIEDEDSANLVPEIREHEDGEDLLRRIATQVISDFDSAWESTEGYRERIAADQAVFTCELPPKEPPYENSSNPHVPIYLENASRVHDFLIHEVFGDWSNVVNFVAPDPSKEWAAAVKTAHTNWQLRHGIPDFVRQMHRGVVAFVNHGHVVGHSYYDPIKRRNQHDTLTADEFVVPYRLVSTSPCFEDCPFVVRVYHYYRHDIQRMAGIWDPESVEKVLDRENRSHDDSPESPLLAVSAEIDGVDISADLGPHAAPYKVLHYEGWTGELPGQDRDRYIQAIVDYSTQEVLQLSIHEEPTWQERSRYRRQIAELEQYRDAEEQYNSGMVAARAAAESDDPRMQLMGMNSMRVMNPVPPPSWMRDPNDPTEVPELPEKSPILMFSQGVNIENLHGAYGLSQGRALADYNRAANVALSMYADAAHLNNNSVLLVAEGVNLPRPTGIHPGAHIPVEGASAQDLQTAIKEIRPGTPAPGLVEIVEHMQRSGQGAMQSPEILSGQPGKSGETWRGVSARIEQATKQLSVSARKFVMWVEQLAKNNSRLNSIYLSDDEVVMVAGHIASQMSAGPGARPAAVTRKMYEEDYDVSVVADLRFSTQAQKVAEADEMVQTAMLPPVMQMWPQLLQATLVKAFEARGRSDLAGLLKNKPQMPPQQAAQSSKSNGAQPPSDGGPPSAGDTGGNK